MILIFVIAISLWLSTIFVININRNAVVIQDRHSHKVSFKQDKFFLKLPYPLQVVEQRISFEVITMNRYLQIGGVDFEFSCQYQVIDARLASFKLNDFEEYFLELFSNFVIQSFEKEIDNIEDKELFIRDKLIATLSRYGFNVIQLTFKK